MFICTMCQKQKLDRQEVVCGIKRMCRECWEALNSEKACKLVLGLVIALVMASSVAHANISQGSWCQSIYCYDAPKSNEN